MDIIQKTASDYNKIARHFSTTRSAKLWPEIEQFRPLIRNGQYILDWGCGNGRLLELFKGFSIHYTGIDISKKLIAICKRKYRRLIATNRAVFYCTARREKKFPKSYFDLVFLVASFHHLSTIASRQRVLHQLYRELKPGGKLIMTVWNLGSDWAKAKRRHDWKALRKNDFLIPWKNPQGEVMVERFYHHFSKQELQKLLEGVGFKVEPFGKYNSGTWPNHKGGQNLVAVARKPI